VRSATSGRKLLGKTDLASIGGRLERLQQSGLGPQVASWLGNCENLPISVDQFKRALGDEHLRQLATQLGLPVDQLLDQNRIICRARWIT